MSLADQRRNYLFTHPNESYQSRSEKSGYEFASGPDSKSLAIKAARVVTQSSWCDQYPYRETRGHDRLRLNARDKAQWCVVLLQNEVQPATEAPTPRILECFQGFVDKIEGPWAHVTLKTDEEEFVATYPALDLASQGVHERDRFELTSLEDGTSVRFEVRLLPRREVSPEERQSIREAIANELGDYSPDDDY